MTINDTSHEFIKTLTDNFLNSLTNQVQQKVTTNVADKMQALDIPDLINTKILTAVDAAIASYKWPVNASDNNPNGGTFVDALTGQFKSSTDAFLTALTQQVQQQVINDLSDRMRQLDVSALIMQHTARVLADTVKTYNFPDYSITGASINPAGLNLSGSAIDGGIIKHFSSTGIQDRANECQVTIFDDTTVVENQLVAAGLVVAGDTIFKGNLILEGTIPDSSALLTTIVSKTVTSINSLYADGLFDQYAIRVLYSLAETGIDAASVKVAGAPLVTGTTLLNTVTGSNLQRVGVLKELQVVGESLLDDTLYVSKTRVGFNTIAPERVLDIWDQEVQIIAGKRQQDTAVIGTIRNQNVIISANNKDQLVVNAADGSVSIKNLNIGKVNHTSAMRMPTDNRPLGQVVWNESPAVGMPLFWVSLGGARWANGTIAA